MIRFTGAVQGAEVLNRAFNRVEEYISDFRSVWPDVAGEIYAINKEQFESEGAAGASGQWTRLTPAYERFKQEEFPGQPILQAEGHMAASLLDPEASDAIYRPLRDVLIIGSQDPKARAHHLGLGNLPARPIFSLAESHKRRIQKTIQRGLVEFARRAGFNVEEKAA